MKASIFRSPLTLSHLMRSCEENGNHYFMVHCLKKSYTAYVMVYELSLAMPYTRQKKSLMVNLSTKLPYLLVFILCNSITSKFYLT